MWWAYLIAAGVVLLVVYTLASLAGFESRWLSRRTDRTAEDMYAKYSDATPPQRRRGRGHGDDAEAVTRNRHLAAATIPVDIPG